MSLLSNNNTLHLYNNWISYWYEDSTLYSNFLYSDLYISEFFDGIYYQLRMPNSLPVYKNLNFKTLCIRLNLFIYKKKKQKRINLFYVEKTLFFYKYKKIMFFIHKTLFSKFNFFKIGGRYNKNVVRINNNYLLLNLCKKLIKISIENIENKLIKKKISKYHLMNLKENVKKTNNFFLNYINNSYINSNLYFSIVLKFSVLNIFSTNNFFVNSFYIDNFNKKNIKLYFFLANLFLFIKNNLNFNLDIMNVKNKYRIVTNNKVLKLNDSSKKLLNKKNYNLVLKKNKKKGSLIRKQNRFSNYSKFLIRKKYIYNLNKKRMYFFLKNLYFFFKKKYKFKLKNKSDLTNKFRKKNRFKNKKNKFIINFRKNFKKKIKFKIYKKKKIKKVCKIKLLGNKKINRFNCSVHLFVYYFVYWFYIKIIQWYFLLLLNIYTIYFMVNTINTGIIFKFNCIKYNMFNTIKNNILFNSIQISNINILFTAKKILNKKFKYFNNLYWHSLVYHLNLKIMKTINLYTNTQVLYFPFYKKKKFFPITDVKMLSDYIRYKLQSGFSIIKVLRKIVKKHTIQKKKSFIKKYRNKIKIYRIKKNIKVILLKNTFFFRKKMYNTKKNLLFNTNVNKILFSNKNNIIKNKKNIIRLFKSWKKKIIFLNLLIFPLLGMRIELNGPSKKGKQTGMVTYNEWVNYYKLPGKMPYNNKMADVHYWQSFARLKRASIGLKIWLFFSSSLYSTSFKKKIKSHFV